MLASFVDGRVRLRHPALKKPETLALLEQSALSLEGVLTAQGNSRTGSLLVSYDPDKLSRAKLLEIAEQLKMFLPAPPAPAAKCSPFRRKTRREAALLSSAMSTVLVGAFINKRLHMVAGGFLVLACARHLYLRRNRL